MFVFDLGGCISYGVMVVGELQCIVGLEDVFGFEDKDVVFDYGYDVDFFVVVVGWGKCDGIVQYCGVVDEWVCGSGFFQFFVVIYFEWCFVLVELEVVLVYLFFYNVQQMC